MLKLSKRIEYGIIAMQYIASKPDAIVSAKEISENLNIPFDFLSKTLQSLMKGGLIVSQQGVRGGYILGKKAEETTIADIIEILDEKANIVDCVSNDEDSCIRIDECTIKQPMSSLQREIEKVFKNTTVADLSKNGIYI